jgi:hypothetical protein
MWTVLLLLLQQKTYAQNKLNLKGVPFLSYLFGSSLKIKQKVCCLLNINIIYKNVHQQDELK